MSSHTTKVQALFERIVEVPPDEQEMWLIANCSDEQVRNDIRNLLGYIDDEMQSDDGIIDDMAPDDLTGSVLDRYVIDRCIGEGIYTDIYLAHQQRPVKRRVAIKLMKLESPKMGQKFQAERQTLALMDHPSISTVFDGGCTKDGRFYLVMEYVDGVPITTYCKSHKLNINHRLELFEQLCSAVQHAHTKGVIHRDLKPENILVTILDEEPKIKVIDFGIAQLLENSTQAGMNSGVSGTPGYMSPEQRNLDHSSADTRSDVYSLGVILYELLTGLNPNDNQDSAGLSLQHEINNQKRAIARQTDATPSPHVTRTQAPASRKKTPRQLHSRLRRDLDWIVMRCLETDPEHRYATPAELSVDIDRHLRGFPVAAGPERLTYHLYKLVSRHRIATAIGCVAFLIAFFGIFIVFELRARSFDAHERADAFRSHIHTFISAVDPETAHYSDRQVVETMLNSASREIDQNFSTYPQIAFQLHMDFAQAFQRIGSYDTALAHYKSSHVIAHENFAANDPNRNWSTIMLGNGQWKSGQFIIANETLLGATIIAKEQLGSDHPHTIEADKYRSFVLNELGKHQEAIVLNENIISRLDKSLGPNHEDTLRAYCNYASTLINLGEAEKAQSLLEVMLITYPDLIGTKHPLNLEVQEDLALAYGELGLLHKSEELERDILAARQELLGPLHPQTLNVMSNLGTTLDLLDRPEEAILLHLQALEGQQNVLGPHHPATVNTMIHLAITLGQLKRYADSEFHERNALEILERTLGSEHPEALIAKSNLAVTLGLRGDLHAEVILEEEVLKSRRRILGHQDPNTLMSIFNLACTLQDIGRLDEAEFLAIEAYEGYRDKYGEGDLETIDCIDELIDLYTKKNSSDDVTAWEHIKRRALAETNTGRPSAGTVRSVPMP